MLLRISKLYKNAHELEQMYTCTNSGHDMSVAKKRGTDAHSCTCLQYQHRYATAASTGNMIAYGKLSTVPK